MAFLAGKRNINTVKYSSILKNSPNFFFFSSFYQLFLERVSVRFLSFSINKNDKFYREKNRQYLTNGNSDFNRTKKFGISIKITSVKNLISTIQTRVRILELDKKIKQPKKIEGCNQKKDRRNTVLIKMIIKTEKSIKYLNIKAQTKDKASIQKIQHKNTKKS
jgi:hypothetical protein